MKTDYFGKVGGKRASECGGATNTRSDTRFPPRFVGKATHIVQIAPTNLSGARLNDFLCNFKTHASRLLFKSPNCTTVPLPTM